MKKLSLFLIVILIFTSIWGCQSDQSISLNGKEIVKINLSKFKDFGAVNENILVEFTNNKDIEVFANAVKNAEEIEGILDVADAQYNIHIVFKDNNTNGYHLWFSQDSGMIMNVENTHIGYTLTKESAHMIYELITAKEKAARSTTPGVSS